MKLTKFLSVAFLSTVFAITSCNDETSSNIEVPAGVAEVGQVSIRLKEGSMDTRSVSQGVDIPGSEEESKIKTIEFYVFNGDIRDSQVSQYGQGYYKFENVEGKEFSFAVDAESNKTVLVATNMSLGSLGTKTLSEVKKEIYDVQATPIGIPTTGIPMAGQQSGITVDEGDIETVRISISRLYAKFNAPKASATEVKLSETLTAEELGDIYEELFGIRSTSGKLLFDLDGYIVINGLEKSYAFENYGVSSILDKWNNGIWEIGNDYDNYFTSIYNDEGRLGTVYSGGSFLEDEEPVYLYENSPKKTSLNGINGFEPASVYALIIQGTITNEATGQTKERYWRINVNKTGAEDPGALYQIIRNAIYNVNIKNVKTIGYGTPEEAEEENKIIPDPDQAGIDAIITVANWMVFNEDADI